MNKSRINIMKIYVGTLKTIENEFKKLVSDAKVEMLSDNKCVVYVPEANMARIIGKQGSNIIAMEEKIGISIDVQPLGDKKAESNTDSKAAVEFGSKITKNSIQFYVDEQYANTNFEIFIDGEYLITAKASKKAIIKIKKANKMANVLADAINSGAEIGLIPKNI